MDDHKVKFYHKHLWQAPDNLYFYKYQQVLWKHLDWRSFQLSAHHNIDIFLIIQYLLRQSSIFWLFTSHTQMIRRSLTTFTLLSFTRSMRTYKSIESIISSILRFDLFTRWIFFRCISSISFLKLKLRFTFTTFYQITHLPNSFILQILKLLITQQPSNLIFHHNSTTPTFQTI